MTLDARGLRMALPAFNVTEAGPEDPAYSSE